MKGSEKMLILIVGAVIILVVVAFGVVLMRPEPAYVADDVPEGVVHNYLLALRRGDYERAYGYLAQDLEIGGLNDFINSAESDRWLFDLGSNVALTIEETRPSGDDAARVEVRKTVSNNELLGSSQYTDRFTVFLSLKDGEWLIVDSQDYWDQCWEVGSSCR